MLAAKAVVIGAVAFVTAAIAAAVAIPLGEHFLDANGNYVFPASIFTELRIVVGCAALVAVRLGGIVPGLRTGEWWSA